MTKKTKKDKCRGCGKSTGKIKYYIIADDLEHPRAYHRKCIDELMMAVWMQEYLSAPLKGE